MFGLEVMVFLYNLWKDVMCKCHIRDACSWLSNDRSLVPKRRATAARQGGGGVSVQAKRYGASYKGVQHNTRVRFTFYTTHRPVPHKQTLSRLFFSCQHGAYERNHSLYNNDPLMDIRWLHDVCHLLNPSKVVF